MVEIHFFFYWQTLFFFLIISIRRINFFFFSIHRATIPFPFSFFLYCVFFSLVFTKAKPEVVKRACLLTRLPLNRRGFHAAPACFSSRVRAHTVLNTDNHKQRRGDGLHDVAVRLLLYSKPVFLSTSSLLSVALVCETACIL